MPSGPLSGPRGDVVKWRGQVAGSQLLVPTAVCLVIGLGLRLPFVAGPLGSDEAGLVLVVRHWDPGPGRLYGDYWVDRPPLLLACFWLADQIPGPAGVRIVGCLASAVLVVAASTSGYLLGGRAGAWWAGTVGATAGSSWIVAGHLANGMIQAAALVMASCAFTLAASRRGSGAGRLHGCCFAAGVFAMSAVLVKQNFVDGLVFGAVVLLASVASGELEASRAVRAFGAGLAGASSAAALLVLWVGATGVDLGELWFAMYGFRAEASAVMTDGHPLGAASRLDTTAAAFVLSGLALITVLFIGAESRHVKDEDSRRYLLGIAALLVVAMAGVVLGGSWWRHYLLQLVPASVLVAALLAPRASRWGAALKVSVLVIAAGSVAGAAIGASVDRSGGDEVQVGHYLDSVAQEGDTGLVTWGHAEILYYGELVSPYPHLWSLPTRTLDPDLTELVAVLRGPHAPTWLLEWNSFNSWDIDDERRLRAAVADRYQLVGTPCRGRLYLLRGARRAVPPRTHCRVART